MPTACKMEASLDTKIYQLPLSGYTGSLSDKSEWISKIAHSNRRVAILMSINESCRVLPIFETVFSDDRPRLLIKTLKHLIDGGYLDQYSIGKTLQSSRSFHIEYGDHYRSHMRSSVFYQVDRPLRFRLLAAIYAGLSFAFPSNVYTGGLYENAVLYQMLYAYCAEAYDVHLDAVNFGRDTVVATQQNRRLSLYLPIKSLDTGLPLAWFTKDTKELADTMYIEERWELAPVLADALMDAGCDNEDVLGQLLNHWDSFGRGVWLIDQLTGRR